MNANPAQLSSIGGTAAIVASVYDINGNPLPNALVSFTTTAGSLGASTVNTDGNGSAVTSLRTVVTATVTATVGATGTHCPAGHRNDSRGDGADVWKRHHQRFRCSRLDYHRAHVGERGYRPRRLPSQ